MTPDLLIFLENFHDARPVDIYGKFSSPRTYRYLWEILITPDLLIFLENFQHKKISTGNPTQPYPTQQVTPPKVMKIQKYRQVMKISQKYRQVMKIFQKYQQVRRPSNFP